MNGNKGDILRASSNTADSALLEPIRKLQLKSIQYRKTVLSIIKNAGAGHTGGSLSSVDILNVLYNRVLNVSPETFSDPNRDRFVQSKGHSVEALYSVLADRGFFGPELLGGLTRFGSDLGGHPTRQVNGIEHNTGALGHGFSFAVGVALAGKMSGKQYRVYALLGDGELAEGSNWEAMMTAAHYCLDNLIIIVDRNGLQITGPTEEVIKLEPLSKKFESFGFAVRECDGNSINELLVNLQLVPFKASQPSLLIAKTRKGKGVSFMENSVKWHHLVPNDREFEQAIRELEDAEALCL